MRIPHGLRAALAGQGGAAPATDSDFENVSLLLHGDGTNGAQNNTFTDGSTNNFTITRNGNTTQGTFSPFSPTGWSGYFDGTGDYVTVPYNAAINISSGDFTIEGWFYFNSTASGQQPLTGYNSTSTYNYAFYCVSSGSIAYYLSSTGSSWNIASGVNMGSISANTWTHIALVRNGSTFTPYVNGVAGTATTNSSALYNGSVPLTIGAFYDGTFAFNGFISNFRIVKGTAVYTSNFTPPTSPLTAITNTSLLTLQDNRFKDNSTNNFAITSNGDTKIEAFSPFNPTAAYSASTHGGSGYFDGSGDWLTAASNTAFDVSASAYTFESWIYWTGGTANTTILFGLLGSANSTGYVAAFTDGSTLYWQQVGSGTNQTTASFAPVVGQWYHIAVGWNGSNSLAIWINGIRVATNTVTPTSAGQAGVNVGGRSSGNALTGYISNFRLVKGTDVYGVGNSTITVPTAPLTAITNTSLLLNFANGGIIDNASKNVLETVGNAQISTSVKKFGTGSLAFDGNGDYLLAPTSEQLNLGSGNWTIEMWVNASASGYSGLVSWRNASVSSLEPDLYVWNTGVLVWYANATALITGTTNIVGAGWVHVAVCKSGSSTKLFVNGTQEGSTYTDNNTYLKPNTTLKVGAVTSASQFFNGYIDDLRITKGVARYTANFTPPTAAFPDL